MFDGMAVTDGSNTLKVTLQLSPLLAQPDYRAATTVALLPGDEVALKGFWDEADAAWKHQQEEESRQVELVRRQALAKSRIQPYSHD